MANTVDIQVINDGPHNVVIKVYLASDGVAGELTNQIIVDASTLSSLPDTLKVKRIYSALSGFQATLKWAATTPDGLWHLPLYAGEFEFEKFGGIPNPKSAGYTGDITITTVGFTAAGDEGSITLECAK